MYISKRELQSLGKLINKIDVRSLNKEEYKSYRQVQRMVISRPKPTLKVNNVFANMKIK
ncbi:hypothetical protein AAK964_12300 [Tissierella praeacuta]|uniref:hypothetical protein n=1 Tax=Tissierella praeacuta TaxID=43131 RepID=UPI003516401E